MMDCSLTLVNNVIVVPIYQRSFNLGPSCPLGYSRASLVYLKVHAQIRAWLKMVCLALEEGDLTVDSNFDLGPVGYCL